MQYKLFANCIPVKGYSRSIICDLQRNMFDLIPNSLYEILANNDVLDFEIFKSNLGFDKAEIINEYESFLLDKQYIFTTKDLNLFPKLSLRWETPVLITNGIIELKEESSPYSLRELLPQFSQIGLQHLEVRLSQLKSYTYFENLLNGIEETNIFSIVLYLNNDVIPKSSIQWYKLLICLFCPVFHTRIIYKCSPHNYTLVWLQYIV